MSKEAQEARFEFKTLELLEALNCIGISVHRKNPILQQFKCVQISMIDGKILFRTLREDSSCDYMLNASPKGEFPDNINLRIAVEFEKLHHIVSKSKRKTIKIIWNYENKYFKVSAEGLSTLNIINTSNWMLPPSDEIESLVKEFDPQELIDAWNSTSFTICGDTNKYALRGILFDGDYATSDSHYVSIFRTDRGKQDFDPLLVAPVLESFIKLLERADFEIDSMEIRKRKDTHIVFIVHTDTGKMRYIVALSAGKFPNWRNFEKEVDERNINCFTVERKRLKNTLSRLSVFVEDAVLFDLKDNKLIEVSAKASDSVQNSLEEVPITNCLQITMGEKLEDHIPVELYAYYNHAILLKICSECKSPILIFRYENNSAPLLIKAGENEYLLTAMV